MTPHHSVTLPDESPVLCALENTPSKDEMLFQRLVESVKDYAIFALDVEGHIVTWNRGAAQLKGYSEKEIIGRHFSVFYPPQDIAEGKPERALEIAQLQGKYEEKGWRVRKDGTFFWADVVITPMWDENGRLDGFAKVTRDLTESVQVSEQINAFFELSLDILCVSDFSGYFTRLNPVLERTLGYSSDELMTTPWIDYIHPDDKAASLDAKSNLSSGTELRSFENRFRCKDGSYRWIHWNATSYPEQQIIFSVGRDITEQKQSEERLRQREAHMEGIVTAAVDGIISIDERGQIETFNSAAERIFGYAAEEVIGQNVAYLMPEPYTSEHDGYLTHHIQTGERKIIGIGREVMGKRKDNSVFPLDLAVNSVVQGNKKIFVGIVRDITERKQLETQLQQTNQNLERLVAERTAALQDSEAQLRLVLDAAPASISYVDRDQRYRFCNKQYTEQFNLKPEEIVGKHVWEVQGQENYALARPNIERALVGETLAYDMELVFPDRGNQHVHVNYVPERAPDGTVQGFIGMVYDITERKKTEDALKESEARYRFLADAVPEIVWTARPDGYVDYYNQRWFDYTGMTLQETQDWGW